MRKLRHREVKEHIEGHTAGKWQSQDSQPSSQAPELTLFTITSYCLSKGKNILVNVKVKRYNNIGRNQFC